MTEERKSRSVEETVLLVTSVLALAMITPFGILRLSRGDFVMAAVDFSLLAILGSAGIYVHRYRRIERPVLILCVGLSVGMLMAVYLKGASIAFWAYPATVILFLVLPTGTAIALNAVNLIVLTEIMVTHEAELLPVITCAGSLLLTNTGALLFALQSRKRAAALVHAAQNDPLTKVGNRRAFDEKMGEALAEVRRYRKPVSLVVLDVDHFKSINDTYSHHVGDHALERLARVLKRELRSTDHLFRIGGEEFAVIATETRGEAAAQLAERLRQVVARTRIIPQQQVTVSLGVSQMDDARAMVTSTGYSEALRQADAALYSAKREGRNRVVQAAPAEPGSGPIRVGFGLTLVG